MIPVRTPYLCVFIFIFFFEKKYCWLESDTWKRRCYWTVKRLNFLIHRYAKSMTALNHYWSYTMCIYDHVPCIILFWQLQSHVRFQRSLRKHCRTAFWLAGHLQAGTITKYHLFGSTCALTGETCSTTVYSNKELHCHFWWINEWAYSVHRQKVLILLMNLERKQSPFSSQRVNNHTTGHFSPHLSSFLSHTTNFAY